MVVVRPVMRGWRMYRNIRDLTDRYPEAMELFEEHYGNKNKDTKYHEMYGSTTPEEMAEQPLEYQCGVAYVLLGRMQKIFQFRETERLGKVIGFEVRECLLSS